MTNILLKTVREVPETSRDSPGTTVGTSSEKYFQPFLFHFRPENVEKDSIRTRKNIANIA